MIAFPTRRAGLLMTAVLVAACAAGTEREPAASVPSAAPSSSPTEAIGSAAPSSSPTMAIASAVPSGSPTMAIASAVPSGSLPVLAEGPVAAGRYVLMPPGAGWAKCGLGSDCPPEPPHARSLQVEITVPAGWQSMFEGTVIDAGSSEGPDGAGLVIGWTSPTAGLHSDPCLPVQHRTPDISVGPTVQEFVDAVLEHPALQVSEAVDVELGGYRGRFLTLTAPSEIGDCSNWRPWEPGIYAQGPNNVWDLWVVEVDGLRMIVLAEYFAGTPPADQAALSAMVESIRFLP